ncbi:hypothetical protein N8385_03195 [Cyclobacteriaceae bacterium]|nr:hypothetical protein [Cyclobacteriaceae bacterium]|tara:strand:+ start:142 stop:870 length:729 start_codon:yes stop_codon:yes gene_type:complete
MKKLIFVIIVSVFINPFSLKAQNDAAVGAAAGLIAIGAGIAAIEQLKENLEQKAVEQVLWQYPNLKTFELKTNSLVGTKMKDLSSVGVVTFEVTNLENTERSILFSFLSSGWSNQYGLDYNKVKWKLFSKQEWNKLMQAYVRTASKEELTLIEISNSKIVNKGVKNGKGWAVEFDKIGGDVYYTLDYSDEFTVVFNERSLGLYLKDNIPSEGDYRQGNPRGDLVQIGRKAIIKAHTHINSQD